LEIPFTHLKVADESFVADHVQSVWRVREHAKVRAQKSSAGRLSGSAKDGLVGNGHGHSLMRLGRAGMWQSAGAHEAHVAKAGGPEKKR